MTAPPSEFEITPVRFSGGLALTRIAERIDASAQKIATERSKLVGGFTPRPIPEFAAPEKPEFPDVLKERWMDCSERPNWSTEVGTRCFDKYSDQSRIFRLKGKKTLIQIARCVHSNSA